MMTSKFNNTTFPSIDDDYIGTESCIDFQNDDVEHGGAPVASKQVTKHKRSSRRKEEKREFPPPIPLLARTQNLASHMPWVLKRYYNASEGRLILKEEKVKHHEYFQAHRANGRLTLRLVPLDDDDIDDEFLGNSTSSIEAATTTSCDEDNTDETDTGSIRDDDEEEEDHKTSNVAGGNDKAFACGPNGGSNCLNCINRVRSSPSCIFQMPVHPIRTVHG